MRPIVPLLVLALPACGILAPGLVDVDRAQTADALDFLVDDDGAVARLEYTIAAGDTPPAVRAAMDRLHPGNPYTSAQIEIHGRQILYQLSRTVDALRVSAVFRADGTLVNEELEVPEEAAPEPVRETVAERFPGAGVAEYEEVRDGLRAVRAYHVRLMVGTQRWKLVVAPDGVVLQGLLEVDAKVAVPVDLP